MIASLKTSWSHLKTATIVLKKKCIYDAKNNQSDPSRRACAFTGSAWLRKTNQTDKSGKLRRAWRLSQSERAHKGQTLCGWLYYYLQEVLLWRMNYLVNETQVPAAADEGLWLAYRWVVSRPLAIVHKNAVVRFLYEYSDTWGMDSTLYSCHILEKVVWVDVYVYM